MNLKSFKLIKNHSLNKIFVIISFLIIFFYYLNYDFETGKGTLIKIAQQDGFTAINQSYGLWGYINKIIFNFFDSLLGNFFSSTTIWEIILGLQVSIIWSFLIYKINKLLNNYFSIILLHPYLLNFLSQCTRDAIAIALFLLLVCEGPNIFKSFLSVLLSFFVHKGILPIVILSTFINNLKYKSKNFFFIFTIISIFISSLIFLILRYTDLGMIIPKSLYGDIFTYPRIWFSGGDALLKSQYIVKKIAYNFIGNFNLKILSFGLIGQILAILWKDKLKDNIFILCFSTFFICSIFSSVPNANRLTYHSLIISGPFYISLIFIHLKSIMLFLMKDEKFNGSNLFKN